MGIKMYVLRLGSFGTDLENLLTGHPRLMLRPGQTDKKKVWYQCPAFAYVIEHPGGRILFETGVSPHWKEEWPQAYKEVTQWSDLTPEDALEQKLKSLRMGPEDFRYVFMGHMHCDHAGGLRLFENAGAEILLHEDEYKGVMNLPEDMNFMARADYEFLPRKKPTLVYGDQKLLKDVVMVSLPGHTWGQMGMLVRLEHTGWVFLTSDAMHHHESYGPPPVMSLISMFQDQWARSMEKIRRLAVRHEAMLVPGHDETALKQPADGGTVGLVKLKFHPSFIYE